MNVYESVLRPMFTTAAFTGIDMLVTVIASIAIGWLARAAYEKDPY